MEEREYISAPVRAGTVVSAEKSRYGGGRAERREAGTSGFGSGICSALFTRRSATGNWGIYRDQGIPSPRSGVDGRSRFFLEPRWDGQGEHFLDACLLCKKPLGHNRDIYMYRGDMPFCSEECRQEQIEFDEARESRNLSMKASASREEHKKKSSQSTKIRAPGTIVAG
ncbi:unnamed protein product [Spirodela intermedia]|uniref:FLZ-type domain-containing protein n=1 Tax=Spirodela intermedia TaxID=51605 RepID=A0A7I8JUS1_SPIIN|nr:unnamed protein product [Spirodela intermedia]CAA6673849.1 unnamed protein product [Spirodela intermedia]